MADATFTHLFGMAVQSDILRQASGEHLLRRAELAAEDEARMAPLPRRRPLLRWISRDFALSKPDCETC